MIVSYPGFILIGLLSLSLVGCSASSSVTEELGCKQSALQADPNPGAAASPVSGSNVMALTVNGSQCLSMSDPNSAVGPNSPCASVTVCPPGATSASDSNCQVISGLLVDTGSIGLRVFRSVIQANDTTNGTALFSHLTPVTYRGSTVAECVTYGDGSADWGPVANATVFMGGEAGVATPIQLIDAYYGGSGTNGWSICNSLAGGSSSNVVLDRCPTNIPASAPVSGTGLGYNGILGLGLYPNDSIYGYYYSCAGTSLSSSSGCGSAVSSITLSASQKTLQNPVSLLTDGNNNGLVLELPSVGNIGVSSANGYVVFGVSNQPNNTPTSVTTFPVDSNNSDNGFLQALVTLNGQNLPAFIDSGSTFYNIPLGSSTSGFVDCGGFHDDNSNGWSGFFCPTGDSNTFGSLTFSFLGFSGSHSLSVSLTLGNPMYFYNPLSANVFSDIASVESLAGSLSGSVDLGLPFYLGRNIYHGIYGSSSSLSSGPYWAF